MKNLLLHICCGPCAITTVEMLRDEGFNVTGFYYNPNIHPSQEYLRRRDGVRQVAARMDFPVIFWDKQQAYQPQDFYRAISFKEHNRCLFCYKLRLQKSIEQATLGAFQYVSTSLLYSKYQNHEAIRKIGELLTQKANGQGTPPLQFYYADFRSGWGRGIKLSKKWEIYRQQYCGCLYSELDRYRQELEAC